MIKTKQILYLFLGLSMACSSPEKNLVEKWDVFEIVLNGTEEGNPYMDIEFGAIFKDGSREIEVPGFYDGKGIYKVRFSPDKTGKWRYQTKSNSESLNNIKSKFTCIEPGLENHGPIKITNTFYLEYADGTPFYSVGTTAYQWTSVSQKIQEQTTNSLKNAPFNKIRMCVFPKSYIYGNETEPWRYPFKRESGHNDLTLPDYEFFQNFDKRIEQLCEMGIQADVILFHPYDIWDYCSMGAEMNEKYVRYMIARISAYRNVWWSLANEWDIPSIKETIDWEGIGNLLMSEDPHNRFRGIHNWYGSEDHFYDHTSPWITHTSTQTSQFYNAIKWRSKYNKPLLFDEMRYEGDVPSGWGNLKAEEMTSYFWMAGLSGGYPTHGETFQNPSDDSSEVRWWAKGGLLVGQSPERISFFKSIMEQAPVSEMSPSLVDNGDPESLNNNIYIFSKEDEFYLMYTAENVPSLSLELPDNNVFKIEILDTWNMEINPLDGEFSGKVTVPLPDKPYIGIRAKRLN
jgi:hypothetical protein